LAVAHRGDVVDDRDRVGEHVFVPVGRILFEPHRRQLGEELADQAGVHEVSSSCRVRSPLADDHLHWAGEAKAEFKAAPAPAAIIVLMAITFLCNGVAVFLRNRYDKRW
jgi:hypothetical protein